MTTITMKKNSDVNIVNADLYGIDLNDTDNTNDGANLHAINDDGVCMNYGKSDPPSHRPPIVNIGITPSVIRLQVMDHISIHK